MAVIPLCCFFVLLLLVFLGISAGIISWTVLELVRFKLPNYQVTNVSLTHFNLTNVLLTQYNMTTNNTLLQYNLSLNISMQNPNKMVGFHYHRLEAVAIFKATSMNSIPRDPFDLGHHKTRFLLGPIVFIGNRWVGPLGDDEVARLKNARVFDVLVRLYVKYWSKGSARRFVFEHTVACPLRVPLTNTTGQSQHLFTITNCIPEKK